MSEDALSERADMDHLISIPAIGDVMLEDINVRFIERFYKELQTTKAVDNPYQKPKDDDDYVTASGIRDIHKLLGSIIGDISDESIKMVGAREDIVFVVYTERIRVLKDDKEIDVIRLISARMATNFERGLYYGKIN